MKQAAENLISQLNNLLPGAQVEIRDLVAGSVWITFSSTDLEVWWEIEIRAPDQFLVHAHYPNDPDDVLFAPPDDWFASARATALYLSAAATIRAQDRHALGAVVLTARKDKRERVYSFESVDHATEFASELARQGIPADSMAFYQREPVPPAALTA